MTGNISRGAHVLLREEGQDSGLLGLLELLLELTRRVGLNCWKWELTHTLR